MYVNKANKLNKSDRFTIIQRKNNGWPVKRIAQRFNVSRQTIYDILEKYRIYGALGLQDHKPGKLRFALNAQFYDKVVEL